MTYAPDIVTRLRDHVRKMPERRAVDFMDSSGRIQDSLSYGELDERARAIGGSLAARFTSRSRIMIAEPPGVNFVVSFFGCLYAGMTAVPVAIPRGAKSDEAERFVRIAHDCAAAGLLAPDEVAAQLRAVPALADLVARLHHAVAGPALDAPRPALSNHAAFLQYTSGSTGDPKGVVVRHRNIVHNVHRIMERCALDADSRALIWLPHFHDLGLVGGILVPLYTGFPTTLLSPVSFLKRPLGWLRAISAGRYTISGGPNFAFRLCAERYDRDVLSELDLSSWRCAFNCAEPVEAATLADFTKRFAPHGFRADAFYPCYGMAEATLTIASHAGARPPLLFVADAAKLEAGVAAPGGGASRRRALVSMGHAASDQHIVIVDPETGRLCPERTVGEVWVRDGSVAGGYWGREEETRAVFEGRFADDPGLSYLRTGDLGFFDGPELYITGRLKDLIIIDGRNLHPEDLEHTVRAAAELGGTLAVAAFSCDKPAGGEQLIILAELSRRDQEREANLHPRILSAIVTRHDVAADVMFVAAGTIPRTTSGKVRRGEARRLYLAERPQPAAREKVSSS